MGLLDDISKLTQPAAELPDVEDDFDASSLVKPHGNRSKNKQNFNFEEGKYAGVAVSSKDIFGDVSGISGLKAKDSESEDDLDDEADDEEDVEEESDVEMEEDVGEKTKKKSNILENLADSDEDEEMDDEEDDDGDSGDDEKEEGEGEEDGEEENLKMTTLSLRDDSDKVEKATSVLHQRQVWDDLSYSNIRIHALLNAMNQMPRGDARRELVKNCDPSTQKSMEAAMENMAKLRDLMAKAGGFFEEKTGKTEDSDDEEIPSDEEILSDSEGLDDEEEEEEEEDETPKKKTENQGTSLKSLKKNLEALDGSIDKFRAATLTKWYNRTKVLSSKSMNNADFSVFEKGSILGQINKVLADEDKLLKKVHTNRSGKTRLGSAPSDSAHDPEIFDDSDFYQVLLKQMLETRNQMNQNSQDGADMTRNYMELQSMISNKKKRDVSQLSSKDRKLKYEPIAKLINFYPSKPSVATWSHESRNELFKSLFS
ncbi:unnamed protein product [Caenorhabditis nigoni]